MNLLLLIIVIILVVGLLPTWPYSRGWGYGYYPSGGLFVVVIVILLVLLLTGHRF